ncbi:MAG: OmpA protein [Solirubrobacterales bacterium]|nr:OmpA protein [Solirubrobacterales bacterium]
MPRTPDRTPRRRLLAAAVLVLTLCAFAPTTAGADVGFRDFSFGAAPSAPSGQKPQNKLWFNDGIWWGNMFNRFTQRFEIYRLDPATESWSTTGAVADTRPRAWSDNLWDGTHLYVASAVYPIATTPPGTAGAKLWRYSYNAGTKTYTTDAGYPIPLTSDGMESVVLDKDGAGRLWITYTQSQQVWLSHSTTDDATWTTPYVMPAPGATTLTPDDISSLVAYNGHVGVMWSNQTDSTMYWASHANNDADTVWTPNTAIQKPEYADDHINLKSLGSDPAGKVIASTKTSLNRPNDPLDLLLVLDNSDTWHPYTVSTVANDPTRSQVMVDAQHRQLYVLAASPCCSGGVVSYKQTSLDAIAFGSGIGTPFIQSSLDLNINNISSTKQSLSAQTGLVAIAGDDKTDYYLHNRLTLPPDTGAPDTQITTGPSGTVTTSSASFEFTSSRAGSTFECTLDAGAYAPCTTPKSYANLANGPHTFSVRAADPSSGNVDTTPAQRTWTVAVKAATVPSAPPPPGGVQPGSAGGSTPVAGSPPAVAVAGKPKIAVAGKPKIVVVSKITRRGLLKGLTVRISNLKAGTPATAWLLRGATVLTRSKALAGGTGSMRLTIKLSRRQLSRLTTRRLTIRCALTMKDGRRTTVILKLRIV